MSRRICLLAASLVLAAPAASLAQSSSQAQYQGVTPETSTPITGSGGTPGAGTNGSTLSGGGGGAGGTGGATHTGGGSTSGASGNGGASGGANVSGATGGQFTPPAVSNASTSTAPFSGGDWVWIVIALAALVGLGFLLRRATRTPAGA